MYDFINNDKYILENFDEEKLKTHINKLREWRRKNNKPVPPNFIIFDDLLGQIDWYSEFMTNWVASFRHTSTSILLTFQYLQAKGGVSTCLRECTSMAFIFNSKFKNSLKALYEAYGMLFDTFDEFADHFQSITKQRFHCMVYMSDVDELSQNYIDFSAPEKIPDYKLDYKI